LSTGDSSAERGGRPDFETALSQLEAIVHDLEEGELGLEQALLRYESGVKLLKQCYGLLDNAERRIELLSGVDSAGNPVTEPFDDSPASLDNKGPSRSRRRKAQPVTPPVSPPPDKAEIDVDEAGGLF
jgi:exodeoxyribonuclease VII small subunit